MCHIKSIFFNLLLVFLICCFAPALKAEKWPAKEYTVIQGDKSTALNHIHDRFFDWEAADERAKRKAAAVPISDDDVAKIESWMSRVAYYYESQGWPAPKHDLLDDGSIPVYVYVFDDPSKPLNAVPSMQVRLDCETNKTSILLDPRHWKNNAAYFRGLAHEQFHTVQYTYKVFQRCDPPTVGEWIREGTAEAVGDETARVLNPRFSKPGFCSIGLRDYGKPLYIKDRKGERPCGQLAYTTSSFWQYLGEYHNLKAKPKLDKKLPADFSYLKKLFKTSPNEFKARAEYVWVNDALKNATDGGLGINLRRAYSSFSGSFSGYFEHRSKYVAKPGKPVTNSSWHEIAYGSACEAVELNPSKKTQKITLKDIGAMSSRCIRVSLPPGQQELKISALGGGDMVEALEISADYGMLNSPNRIRPLAGTPMATFNFAINSASVGPAQDKYFIISHASYKAHHFKSFSPSLRFTLAANTGNSASGKKTASRKKQGYSDESFAQELAENMEGTSWRGRVSQLREQTNIALELVPDEITALKNPAESASIKTMVGRAKTLNPEEDLTSLILQQQKIAETEGSKIRIYIPRIEFGYTGSVSDAKIEMNKPMSHESSTDYYISMGIWEGSCQKGGHIYTGRVIIEEASVDVLSGSYTADVYDQDLGSKYFCRNIPVYKTINGRFSILNPDLNNDSQHQKFAESEADFVINEVSELVPGVMTSEMKDRVREKLERSERDKERERQSHSNPENVDTCDCANCLMAAATVQKPGCFEECEEQFRQCKTPPFSQIKQMYDLTRKNTPQEEANIIAMRAEIVALLDAKEPKRYVRETWLKQFDEAPLFLKRKIYEQIVNRYAVR